MTVHGNSRKSIHSRRAKKKQSQQDKPEVEHDKRRVLIQKYITKYDFIIHYAV